MKSDYFNNVRDFVKDNNGTHSYRLPVRASDGPETTSGSVGLRPDLAAMAHEPWSRFDELADAQGWDGRTRKVEAEIAQLIARSNRVHWLREQIRESARSNSAPLPEMSVREQAWFFKEINAVQRRLREKRRAKELSPSAFSPQPFPL